MVARRVLITGVGRGLGRELASQLVARGDEVWGSTRTGRSDLGLAGCLNIEMSDEASIVVAAAELSTQTDGLDVLINCAGVDARAFGSEYGERGPFDLDAQTFNRVMEVNVTGPMVLTREVLPLLRNGSGALILNLSSQLASMQAAANMGSDAVYCVSKAALNMLSLKTTTALRDEGITVVMIHPGWVQTDMGGSNASLTIEESAATMIERLETLNFSDTGRFIKLDGTDHPW